MPDPIPVLEKIGITTSHRNTAHRSASGGDDREAMLKPLFKAGINFYSILSGSSPLRFSLTFCGLSAIAPIPFPAVRSNFPILTSGA